MTLVMASEPDIASVFGAGFAGDVLALAGDDWAGPVASAYGLHLVRIDERVPTRLPQLAEVRQQVEHEYEAAERAESKQRFLRELRERYDVEIRMPPALQPTSTGR
jgi:parvulin-like peptidyl-prolyl isomerase